MVDPDRSAVGGKTWSLVWEWSSLTSVVSGAPSASLAESGTSALPGLRALLGSLPVVGLGDGAVLIVWVSGSVLGPVSSPDSGGVVEVLSGGWDNSVSKTNLWWDTSDLDVLNVVWVVVVSGLNGGEQGSDSKEFHNIELKK